MKRTKWTITIAASMIFLCCLFLLLNKLESPFGRVFWISFYGLLISLLGLIGSLGIHLIQNKQLIVKIVALLPLLLVIIGSFLLLIGSWDYRMLLPITSSNSLSKEAYQEDIDSLKSILPTHPGYNDSIAAVSLPIFQDLEKASQYHDRDAFVFETIRLLGLFQDGHSYVPPFQVYNQTRYLPLNGFYFEDGFYILSAAKEYEGLINKKLVAINGIAVEDIFRKIMNHTGPENQWNAKSRLNFYLFSTNILRSLGILEDNSIANISYENGQGLEQERRVRSTPFFNWLFWALTPVHDRRPISNALRKPNFQLHIQEGRLDLELNLIEDISGQQTMESLAKEIDSLLASRRFHHMVIDLRNNLGGNNQLYDPIIQCLKKHSQIHLKDRLFVFMSRNTFSAGINLLDDLDFHTNAILIGEPAGAGPTHYGDAAFFQLPNSGVFFFLSTRQWKANDGTQNGKVIQPDVEVSYFFADYLHGKDPWEKAIKKIGN